MRPNSPRQAMCANGVAVAVAKMVLALGVEERSKGTLVRYSPDSLSRKSKEEAPTQLYRLQFRCHAMCWSEEASSRRQFVLGCGAISSCGFLNLNCELAKLPAWAGEESNALDDKNDSVLGTMKSLFDPNEKTKSGKVLPKAYLKSAREMVKTLRESLKEDSKDIAKFRRTADAAKESIRDYLNGWRGQKTVVNEESYVVLEKAIRSLASFYSKAGPSAPPS
ncbi:Photosystem II D1 precursor processing protein PSB27-H2 [Abeliophyllum distichum]|uniref:Photosystem II D1 processing protein PSB27-H2 n=1 Tax=Abeliophyllum distichum TaxID=126358 RepID=A0ABD1NP94_9LAMI